MRNGQRIRVAKADLFSQSLAVFLYERVGDHFAVATQVVMQERRAEGQIVEPTMHLDPQAAQELMDSLWDAGVRPAEGHGSTGQLAATERHLNDMRRLVFEPEAA
jgi:hypothetical protein